MSIRLKKYLLIGFIWLVVWFSLCPVIYHFFLEKKSPLVSVVLPVYNGVKKGDLYRSIPSILTQTYPNFELILIDDGSVDDSWAVLQLYASMDKRVRLFKNDKNQGISYTRNYGNSQAKGKYIMIMDQDDVSLPTRIERQVLFMENRPWLDVVATPSITPTLWTNLYNEDDIKFLLFFNNNYGHPNLMVKKSFLDENTIQYNLDFKCANDYEWLVQILEKGGRFGTMREALFAYNGANLSSGPLCYEEAEKLLVKWASPEVIWKKQGFEAWACEVATYLKTKPQYVSLFSPGALDRYISFYCKKSTIQEETIQKDIK